MTTKIEVDKAAELIKGLLDDFGYRELAETIVTKDCQDDIATIDKDKDFFRI